MAGDELHRIPPCFTKYDRCLRLEATVPECLHWGKLGSRRGPVKLRRQFPIAEWQMIEERMANIEKKVRRGRKFEGEK